LIWLIVFIQIFFIHNLLFQAFMEKHWDKFSEDEIMCLAQTFINTELLGCKYPPETMTQVAQLAQEVPEIVRYRISRRNTLQRTFVGAQDAVQAKLKKSDAPRKLGNNSTPMEGLEDWSTTERAQFKMNLDKTQKLDNLRGLLRDVINFEVSDNSSAGLSKTIANMQKIGKLEMNYDEKKYLYVFNGQIIGEGSGATKKEAKKKADEDFVSTLKKNCYTIKHKLAFYTAEDIVTPTTNDDAPKDSNKLKEDNLGFKMLKMLGWTGGSLGSKGEGIVDPVSCEIKIGRGGLGSEQLDPKHIRELLRNFKNSQVEYDLVFSSDFTKEERAQIHM
jgi:XRN-Two Binding Domain, XTBD/G-patch domain